MNEEYLVEVAKVINRLYVTERSKYIEQYLNKETNTVAYNTREWTLVDKNILEHLKQKRTIGIFSFRYKTKFITFDVDTKENSRLDTLHLISVLENDFNISRNDIHVSLSGLKGYHVTIFFSKSISNDIARKFYNIVINRANFTQRQVEYRPQFNVGMKLPLGLHKKANKVSWFVDNQTLKPIKNYSYVFDIKTIDVTPIIDVYDKSDPIVVEHNEAVEFDDLTKSINVNTVDTEENLEHINYVLENNCLKYEATRNDVTLMTAIYLKDVESFSIEDTTNTLLSIMLNTKRTKSHLISSSTEFIERETKRIVNVVYKYDYKFSNRRKDVCITRSEIEDILSIKKWNLKQMYFIHLIHAKRYAKQDGSYYMTYKTMNRYGATSERQRAKQQIEELHDFIEIKSNNEVDRSRSLEQGKIVKKPNFYKIKKIFDDSSIEEDRIVIKEEEIDLVQILQRFAERYDLNLREQLSRKQYEKVQKVV